MSVIRNNPHPTLVISQSLPDISITSAVFLSSFAPSPPAVAAAGRIKDAEMTANQNAR